VLLFRDAERLRLYRPYPAALTFWNTARSVASLG
jgi:hypothetical protein